MKIDKDVEIPSGSNIDHGETGKYSQVICEMEKGDSIFFDGDDMEKSAAAVKMYFWRKGIKTCRRKIDGGVRVWRIS